jgi:hypothetical protein
MRLTKKFMSMGVGVASVGLLLFLGLSGALPGLGRSPAARAAHAGPPPPKYASYLQMVGIKPMDLDAANRGARRDGDAWVLGDVDLEAARALAEKPQDLDTLAHTDHKWIPTQTWKLRHGGATPFAEAKEACSIRHLVTMEHGCMSNVSVVVERETDDEGRVVYAKPRYSDTMDDECRAYTDCVAHHAWLGRTTPLPPDADDLNSFKAGDVRFPLQGTADDLKATVDDDIAACRRNLAVLRKFDPASDPFLQQNITLYEDLLEHSEWLLSL